MKTLILFIFLMFPFLVFASTEQVTGLMGMLNWISDFFSTIFYFFFVYLPSLIGEFFIWLAAYALKMKFYFLYNSLVFAHEVATTFLELIDMSTIINSAISALPQDFRQIASELRFFESLTLVIEAWITRLVYSWF
ncbi:MAG: hypothetical protein HRT53_20960 [Colwellia sp.]|nr:hypothetical protein [Colwellia sp.]